MCYYRAISILWEVVLVRPNQVSWLFCVLVGLHLTVQDGRGSDSCYNGRLHYWDQGLMLAHMPQALPPDADARSASGIDYLLARKLVSAVKIIYLHIFLI
jgi:hypothetical protein